MLLVCCWGEICSDSIMLPYVELRCLTFSVELLVSVTQTLLHYCGVLHVKQLELQHLLAGSN